MYSGVLWCHSCFDWLTGIRKTLIGCLVWRSILVGCRIFYCFPSTTTTTTTTATFRLFSLLHHHCKIRRVLAKTGLILDEMCRLYGKFASYLRRVLCTTRPMYDASYFSSYKWPYWSTKKSHWISDHHNSKWSPINVHSSYKLNPHNWNL